MTRFVSHPATFYFARPHFSHPFFFAMHVVTCCKPQRRLPIFFGQIWGILLMRLTRCTPKLVNYDILEKFYGRCVVVVVVVEVRWLRGDFCISNILINIR